jgi:hypothetical protein
MNLIEAIDGFSRETPPAASPHAHSIELLRDYLSAAPPGALTGPLPEMLRDFLSRWYIEATASKEVAFPDAIVESLTVFLTWLDARDQTTLEAECSPLLHELLVTVPRALEITAALSMHLAERGGAFSFPEFLTTFANGGQSSYDISVAGEGKGPGAVEGYFRVLGVEGSCVQLQELISEERYSPVICPEEVVRLIEPFFIVNLEIVRVEEGWQIAACGFAYPPGTDI